ncbi:MAG: hypothetical protein QGI78_00690 [Phycisphaerales bacterium]|nr:hypothetical protein [Phycisphaerales bacterium]
MEITTKLATRYWLKTIIMAIVCVVLGLWGIWDYVVAIPQKQEAAMRNVVLKAVNAALNTEKGSGDRSDVSALVNLALEEAAQNPVSESGGAQMDLGNTAGWIKSLELFQSALSTGDYALQADAVELIDEGLGEYGSVTAPSKYDRPMQWLFILCLPFGFYYFWAFGKMSARAKMYRLDEQGTLTTPDGTWTADQIVDIDMSKWIAPTGNARATWTAKAKTSDGKSILLDDYIFANTHLIIGTLAHKFYPDEWTPLAKRVKIEQDVETDPNDQPEDE